MKKFIWLLLLLAIILFCAGLYIKEKLVNPSASQELLTEPNLNFCLQNILWLPIGLIGGGILLFFPKPILEWLNEVVNFGAKDSKPIKLNQISIRFAGAAFFILTLMYGLFNPQIWISCSSAMSLLW